MATEESYIGLLSDTHGFMDQQILDYLDGVDEIWHAGDFGNMQVAAALEKIAPLRGVYGNIDGQDLRLAFPLNEIFDLNGLSCWMTHIAGRPGRYPAHIKEGIVEHGVKLFVCGHSHVALAGRDPISGALHLNPGAAGRHGFHKVRTMMRFHIREGKVEQLELIELGPRSAK